MVIYFYLFTHRIHGFVVVTNLMPNLSYLTNDFHAIAVGQSYKEKETPDTQGGHKTGKLERLFRQ